MTIDIRIPKDVKKYMEDTIKKCNDQIDFQGWRFSYNVGIDPYQEFDLEERSVQKAFWYAVTFLKRNFGKKGQKETVNSYDLKHGFEKWWASEYPAEPKVYMSNGLMLLAVVYTNLTPSELWYSMEQCQYACIPKGKWDRFCKKYDYTQRYDPDEDMV
jgi:hypothetical protein